MYTKTHTYLLSIASREKGKEIAFAPNTLHREHHFKQGKTNKSHSTQINQQYERQKESGTNGCLNICCVSNENGTEADEQNFGENAEIPYLHVWNNIS